MKSKAGKTGRSTIKGNIVRIRQTTCNELPFLAQWWADPAVMTPVRIPNGIHMSPNEWDEWFEAWCSDEDTSRRHFIIFDQHETHIGEIYYHDLDRGFHRASIGAKIGIPELWGKGYAPDAVTAFCTYMFNTIGVNELTIEVAPTNSRALAFWQKMKFTTYARSTDTVNMRLRKETFHTPTQP